MSILTQVVKHRKHLKVCNHVRHGEVANFKPWKVIYERWYICRNNENLVEGNAPWTAPLATANVTNWPPSDLCTRNK